MATTGSTKQACPKGFKTINRSKPVSGHHSVWQRILSAANGSTYPKERHEWLRALESFILWPALSPWSPADELIEKLLSADDPVAVLASITSEVRIYFGL